MILFDRDIKARLRDGSLGIEGIDPDGPAIQPASVDLECGRGQLDVAMVWVETS
jgi:deoxycytidine triphosphate deaminase